MRHSLCISKASLLAALAITTLMLAAQPAHADSYPAATISTLPHRSSDGFTVWPADGDSLTGVYRLGDKELRLQIHGAFVPAAGSVPGANGVAAASVGGCVVDESGLLLSGWGTDAEGKEYSDLPQVLGDAAAADDAVKLDALQTWCEERDELWQGFVSLSRELEIEDYAAQSALLGPRYPAWALMLAQARNMGALCLFAKHYTGRAASLRDHFARWSPDSVD